MTVRTSLARLSAFASFVLMLGLLAGCGGGSGSSSTPTPGPTQTPEPATVDASQPMTLGPVVWSTAIDPLTNEAIAPATEIPASVETIYAVAPVGNSVAGTELTAAWWFNDTTLDAFSSQVSIDEPIVEGWVECHITRTDGTPWPDGTYEVAISSGGVELQRSTVQVVNV